MLDREMAFITTIIILLIAAIIWLGVYGIRANNEARARCEATGRRYVVDHYITTFIPIKVGKTTVMSPVQNPVYACVE